MGTSARIGGATPSPAVDDMPGMGGGGGGSSGGGRGSSGGGGGSSPNAAPVPAVAVTVPTTQVTPPIPTPGVRKQTATDVPASGLPTVAKLQVVVPPAAA